MITQINKSFNQPSSLVVPVFNVVRAELKLSPEAKLLFAESNVDVTKIICIDEIDLASLASKGRLKMSIVNHNVLADYQLVLAPAVIEIIDHHEDQTGDLYGSNVAKMIEPVATCTSLVAEFFTSQMPQALEKNPDLVRLLLGVILLKTDNMDASSHSSEKDKEMVDQLVAIGSVDRSQLFGGLDAVSLYRKAYKLLRKDYLCNPNTNLGVTLGCSVVTISWQDFMALDGALDAVLLIRAEENLDFVIVICIDKRDGEVKQFIGIYSEDEGMRKQVVKLFLSRRVLKFSEMNLPENQKHLSCLMKEGELLSRLDLFDLITVALSQPTFKSFVDDIASVHAMKDTAQVSMLDIVQYGHRSDYLL